MSQYVVLVATVKGYKEVLLNGEDAASTIEETASQVVVSHIARRQRIEEVQRKFLIHAE